MNFPIFPSLKRFARSSAASICCCLLWILPPQPAAAEPKADDNTQTLQLLADFHSAEQTGALKPVTDADASYRSKLEKFQKTAQDAGNLKSVLAAKEAITELDAGRPPQVSDDAEVAAIQKTYMAQRQKADAESAKALAKVDQDYLASLKKLVADLTKAGKIDQAVEVQTKVDELAAAPQPGAATPNPGAEELEIWKKKALAEFPALKDPASPLSKKIQALREEKKITPRFFENPQWPYLLAKEASLDLQKTAGASNLRIPAEAKSFNGKKYFVYEDKCSWKTARNRCEKLGGQLVVISDEPTQAFVKGLIRGKSLWLGASDDTTEGEWKWVDGTNVKYNSFKHGEPNNMGEIEHFLLCFGDGSWNDATEKGDMYRQNVTGYICEWSDN